MTEVDPELLELYQAMILDHGRHPRNFEKMPDSTHSASGYNPLCGDQIELFLKVGKDQQVTKASFQGHGCAISQASASVLTQIVQQSSVEQALATSSLFQAHCKGEVQQAPQGEDQELDPKLEPFTGVKAFPARVKCATLAWHALDKALSQGGSRLKAASNRESDKTD